MKLRNQLEETTYQLGRQAWTNSSANIPHQDKKFMKLFGVLDKEDHAQYEAYKEIWTLGREDCSLETTGRTTEFWFDLWYTVGVPVPLKEAMPELVYGEWGWVYSRKAGGFFKIQMGDHLIKANELLRLFYGYDSKEELKRTGSRDNWPYKGGELFLAEEGNAIKSSHHKDDTYAVGFEESMNDDELDVLGYDYEVQEKHYT